VEPEAGASGRVVPGECLCGAVRFEIELPTVFCGHCHCTLCRRAHGAGFVTWCGVPKPRFHVRAGRAELAHFRSSAHGVRSFCSRCGSQLFCELATHPGVVDVVLASLRGEIDRAPQVHVFWSDRADWMRADDGLPRLGGPTGVEPLPEP
jgi:hypothetical protein